ncbi:hypothetical protein Cadr_000022265 [Camelus dromedarius]|uniref:Uncharacterized protein n=1 Tax=Camelus dromedarius TaxID=9838 RepID=A0A5N4CQH9_CAMDR|nr:hypothetical protein Cadr_000022265 [Camelus dromedarius]
MGAVGLGAAGPYHGLPNGRFKPDQLFLTGQGTDRGVVWNGPHSQSYSATLSPNRIMCSTEKHLRRSEPS